MTTPTYPGVYIQELVSPVHTIAGVATSITAFVGYTARGIDNRAELIFSFSDFERLFGGLAADSELSYAVQQFFQNGGTQAYVVRVPRTGAGGAQVVFDALTFTALSSGSWANGELLVDVDYNNLYKNVAGSVGVTAASAKVTGTGTAFQSALKAGQFLVFASDATQTPYQILSIADDKTLTLAANYGGATQASTTAIVSADPTAFNLTITNDVDGTVESFPSVSLNSSRQNYVLAVVNDPDNGSQLVNVSLAGAPPANPPAISGVVSTTLLAGTVVVTLTGTAATGTAKLTQGSAAVTGTGTAFSTDLKVGQSVVFGADPTATQYQVQAIASSTALTLSSNYAGVNAAASTVSGLGSGALKDFGVQLNVTSPSTPPAPLPLDVKIFSKNVPVPQTVTGLAAQLQSAINAALAVQMPGASVTCSVSAIGSNQSIRVNAAIPQFPDAVLTIGTPAAALSDLSTILGLKAPGTANVAHYATGTGNGSGVNGWGGQQTSSQAGADGSGLPGSGDLIGDPALFTGIYALDKVDLFNLLCIPDATRAQAGNPSALDSTVDPNAIYGAAIAMCDRRRSFLLLDAPPNVNTVSGAVDYKTSGLVVHDANGAVFFPRLRLPDPLNSFQLRTFAPSGVVAGLYARIDSTRGVWKAPAGTEATLSGVQGLVYKLNDAENGVLNPLGMNCFRTFPVYGNVLWGSRTLVGSDADANQWKYVPVRRIALYLEESLYRGTQWVVFEPNDEPLWAAIRLNVTSFMQELFRKGAFQGQTPADAYFVKCDKETTTQDDIDRGIVNILVGFAPLKPAEFVIIQIEQLAGQSQT
ncbi:MAG: phage tail sheath C-terminal domain-containing protein [Candidatus Sulfotelmatobacter sp.]